MFEGFERVTEKTSPGRSTLPKADHSLSDISFPLHLYTRRELVDLSVLIFKNFGLVTALQTTDETLHNLISELARRYNKGPYHHFTHAFYLLHLSQWICLKIGWEKYFKPLDIASMFIAALAHDVNHPSTNNAYQNRINSKAAQVYSGKSVLENHHVSIFFQLLKSHPETNILANLSREEKSFCESAIIEAILKTDMACHFDLCKKFKNTTDGILNETNVYDKEDSEQRVHLMSIIIHSCDIGTSALPFELFDQWGARCIQEFHEQYETEAADELGEATTFMKYQGKLAYMKSQVGFLNAIVVPMWKDMDRLFPEIGEAFTNIENNISALSEMSSEMEDQSS